MCIVSIYFQTLFYLFSLFAICLTQTCYEQFNVQLCDIDISVHPIAQLPQTQRLGESLETCLGYFKAFTWDIGIYCSALKFCGLGLDLSLDYRSYWNREEFTPADTLVNYSGMLKTKLVTISFTEFVFPGCFQVSYQLRSY